jgi:ketosteroid isomerase-like protein
MRNLLPDVVNRYLQTDARRDVDAVVALFTDDAVVVDEGETRRRAARVHAWREGPASRYQYTAEVFDTDRTGEDEYVVSGLSLGQLPRREGQAMRIIILEGSDAGISAAFAHASRPANGIG